MALSHRFSVLGRSFEARVHPHGKGPGVVWVADVFESEMQRAFNLPLCSDMDLIPDEKRDEALAELEGVIESQCRRGVL